MDFKTLSPLLVEFAVKHQEKWNELDGAQGDGDLGLTILYGASALSECAITCHTLREWFETGGKHLRKAAPSTMGILIASALIAASKKIPDGHKPLSNEDWIMIQETMIDEIQKRGGAKLGDKTVLDALIPAAQKFAEIVDHGGTLQQALLQASLKARQGAEHTRQLVSQIGRSSWLRERSIGNIDGGAWVCYQIYELLAHSAKQEQ